MNTQAKLLAGGIFAAVLLVFGFMVKHEIDARNTGRIAVDDSLRKVEAVAHVVAQKKTDSASHVLDSLARNAAHVDTAWVTRKVVVNHTVQQIVINDRGY